MLSHKDTMVKDTVVKDIVMLGTFDEVMLIDMIYIDELELEQIIEFIHEIAYHELLSRNVKSMTDWSVRAISLFNRYDFSIIDHIVSLTKNQVNALNGCGYKTRKEIYDTCISYGLTVPTWTPGDYYNKMNYIFEDEGTLER